MVDIQTARRTLRRFSITHRRSLAAICVGLGVFSALSALEPDTRGTDVVAVATDIPAGQALDERDLRIVSLPEGSVPDGSHTTLASVTGRTSANPIRSGEVITDVRLMSPALLAGYPAGSVLASLRIEDPSLVEGLRSGDLVNVIASDPQGEDAPEVIARAVPIVSVPVDDDARRGDGIVLRLAAPEATAERLAAASVASQLTLVGVAGPPSP